MKLVSRLLLAFVTVIRAAQVVGQPAVPIDPIDGVLEAFAQSDIVALGEGPHRNEQAHVIRIELIRDPRFAGILNDIVVEFGSARYQDVMDQFIAGNEVAYSDLRRAWEDTSAVGDVWDRPIYEEFFRTVRAVNEFLPEHQRYRVLLGDPRFYGSLPGAE
jgi:hypothetical protein